MHGNIRDRMDSVLWTAELECEICSAALITASTSRIGAEMIARDMGWELLNGPFVSGRERVVQFGAVCPDCQKSTY